MRTTLTLDDDVARLLADAVHRERRPLKQVLNDALRRGFAGEVPSAPFRTTPHVARLLAGIDPGALNRLADELEDEVVVDRLRRAAR
jgi:hypothetical protein